MPELVIHVPSYIGPSYLQESEDGWFCEWVQGITKEDVEMQIQWAEMMGQPADSILLEISTCDGGSTIEGFAIYNYLRSLGLPIRCRILALAASMAVPLALAADNGPEMEYTAQLMLHSASFQSPIYVPTSADLRAQADRLDNTNQLLSDLLVARSGQTAEIVAGWMSQDTWLTATQAKAVGLCSKVNPLTARLTAVEADSVITARRTRSTATMARAERRPVRLPSNTPKPQAAAKRPAAKASPKPMAKNATPAAKAATKKAAPLTAQQKANAQLVANLAKSLGVPVAIEGVDDEPTAEVLSTETDQAGALLYHDGPLAQGSAVFYDEALTEAAEDGDYGLADGRTITVAAGVVEAIVDAEASNAAAAVAPATLTAEAITAAVNAALAPITARLDGLDGQVKAFNKVVPPTPRPAARAASGSQAAFKEQGNRPHPMDNAKSK